MGGPPPAVCIHHRGHDWPRGGLQADDGREQPRAGARGPRIRLLAPRLPRAHLPPLGGLSALLGRQERGGPCPRLRAQRGLRVRLEPPGAPAAGGRHGVRHRGLRLAESLRGLAHGRGALRAVPARPVARGRPLRAAPRPRGPPRKVAALHGGHRLPGPLHLPRDEGPGRLRAGRHHLRAPDPHARRRGRADALRVPRAASVHRASAHHDRGLHPLPLHRDGAHPHRLAVLGGLGPRGQHRGPHLREPVRLLRGGPRAGQTV
mmetsp:Transcript_18622/g.62426  ORF Transcript_18622/g.62426 Transcript_18622/m.62426 type:complete len:262 (-) Transcript_18622:974-1759(-)